MKNGMTLREQIEALPAISSASASWDKGGTLHIDTIDQPLVLDRQAVLDIIDAHRCEPHTVITHIEAHIDRDALARALHIVSGMPHPEGTVLSEFECYCRRIATVDTTPDGPIDPGWGEAEFDPAAWGETAQSPTGCEMVADAIITKLEEL